MVRGAAPRRPTSTAEIESLRQDPRRRGAARRQIRAIADARAVQIYEDSTQGLGTMFGDDPLELGRRAALIGQANAEGQKRDRRVERSVADLNAQRGRSSTTPATISTKTLARARLPRRRTLDAQLATLQLRSASPADRTCSRPRSAAPESPWPTPRPSTCPPRALRRRAGGRDRRRPRRRRRTPAGSARITTTRSSCAPAPGERRRLQRRQLGGYYGAYQFASHDLERTLARRAASTSSVCCRRTRRQYDQDEMAWALYQWQGDGRGAVAVNEVAEFPSHSLTAVLLVDSQ